MIALDAGLHLRFATLVGLDASPKEPRRPQELPIRPRSQNRQGWVVSVNDCTSFDEPLLYRHRTTV